MSRRYLGGPRRIEQAARDVLDGRAQPAAAELLDLIHAVNPTGRSLAPADEQRRYQLKAGLQSVLVRRFADDLEVTAEPGGVVAIRHKYLRQDGCHAQLDELDLDVRAQLRRVLDLGGDAEPEPDIVLAEGSGEIGDVGPVALGRAALAEYDYDAARAHFEDALATTAGGAPAARALLGLLVDHLALDAEALAIGRQLADAARSDGEVRALLGHAAARSGEIETARRFLRGVTGSRAGDAWAAMGQVAATRADPEALAQAIERLAELAPAHPELITLRDEAARLRAEERRPAEDALARLSGDGDDAAIEREARALLARWPESAIAGAALARIRADRRRTEAAQLLARAEAALAERQLQTAGELARRASALGADADDLRRRVADAEAEVRRAREDAAVAAVSALVADDDPRAGLDRYLTLDAELRARVRATVSEARAAILAWLDAADDHAKSAKPAHVIDAVLAIEPALAAHERGDDEGALVSLDPHVELIAGVPAVRALLAGARRRLAERRREDAATTLAEARRAVAEGDLDRGERLCHAIDRRGLDAVARATFDEIVATVRARRDLARRRARIEALAADGDLVAARAEADAFLASGPGDATLAEELRARREHLVTEVRRAWRLRVDDTIRRLDDHDPIGELWGRLPWIDEPGTWLVADGDELIVATAHGAHVFVGRVALAAQHVVRRHYLRAPEALGMVLSVDVDRETVWLYGETGRVLQIDARTGEPLRWSSLAMFVSRDEHVERAFVSPGGAYLWVEVWKEGVCVQRVIEIDGWRLRRELADLSYLHPVITGGAPAVLATHDNGTAALYSERGTVAERLAYGMHVLALVPDPGGEFVAMVASYEDEAGKVEVARVVGGRVVHRQPLPDSNSDRPLQCAVSRRRGLVFVHHGIDGEEESRLVALRAVEGAFEPVFSVRAPMHGVLAQDPSGQEAVWIWETSRSTRIVTLGAEPPLFGKRAESTHIFLPALGASFLCLPITGADEGPTGERLRDADRAARSGDWPAVVAALAELARDDVAAHLWPHVCHLLGLAILRTGRDPARARTVWEAGLVYDQTNPRLGCRLGACLEILAPLPDPLPDKWWDARASIVRQLRGVIATADARLAAGDPRAALDVLRRRVVIGRGEVQSTARLASAWLAVEPADSGEAFDKAIALARFVAIAEQRVRDLPIAEAWGADAIDALVACAEAWLDRWGAPPG